MDQFFVESERLLRWWNSLLPISLRSILIVSSLLTPESSKWSLAIKFSYYSASGLFSIYYSHLCYKPTHLTVLDLILKWSQQIMTLLHTDMQFSILLLPSVCRVQTLSSGPYSQMSTCGRRSTSILLIGDRVSHPYTITGKLLYRIKWNNAHSLLT